MTNKTLAAVAAIVLLLVLLPTSSGQKPEGAATAIAASHVLQEQVITGHFKCSATAIGPHALLTASHCEKPTNYILVDGVRYMVSSIVRDDNDHTIYFLQGPEFAAYANVSQASARVGQDIYIIGAPGNFGKLFRRGTVAGFVGPKADSLEALFAAAVGGGDPKQAVIYDYNGFFGDSGSAVFDENGRIIGIISSLYEEEENSPEKERFRVMEGWPLRFSADQLQRARTWPKG